MFGTKLHTCMKKIRKTTKAENKTNQNKKGQKMRQNKITKTTKQKIGLLVTIITITTSCATNNNHKKLALKIIKNNNVILKEIKKERKEKPVRPNVNKSRALIKAERRLITAINAVIISNNTLKKEFTKKSIKEANYGQNERHDYR